MEAQTAKITSFTQLRTWQCARDIAVIVYKTSKEFPVEEKFGLSSQMRRSAVSVSANIAEGFSRNTAKDKVNFYSMALGSLTETLSHAFIGYKLGFVTQERLQLIEKSCEDLHKMINGLMKSAKGKNT
jgi:four helix bundle protein